MQQIDLEEWIEEQNLSEPASAAVEAPLPPNALSVAPSETGDDSAAHPASHTDRLGEDGRDTIESIKEAAHFQERPSPPPGDYRNLLRPIQRMLDPGKDQRRPAVCLCGYARGSEIGVHLVRRNGADAASVTGIYRCGSGESCPFCAPHVAALRAKRYRLVHEAVAARSGRMLTLTLTLAHDPGDSLEGLLKALKAASTGARSGGNWNRKIRRALNSAGVLVDAHVRWSRNGGWHPHLHLTIACLTDDEDAISTAADLLIERYVALLARLGFRAGADQQSAFILRNDPTEGGYAYPAFHHRPAEVEGDLRASMDDDTSLSPFDIARLAAAGNAEMERLFIEFSRAMHGTKCAVITAPMARTLGIEPDADTPGLDDATRLGTIPSRVWAGLLNENLQATFLSNVVTFGRQGWRRVWWWAHTETGHTPPVLDDAATEIMTLFKAMHRLDDADAKTLAQDMIDIRIEEWTARHGPALVSITIDYAEAHWRYLTMDDVAVADLMNGIEKWAAKRALRRRWEVSHTTLPVRDGTSPADAASHGSIIEHVGQNGQNSHHL